MECRKKASRPRTKCNSCKACKRKQKCTNPLGGSAGSPLPVAAPLVAAPLTTRAQEVIERVQAAEKPFSDFVNELLNSPDLPAAATPRTVDTAHAEIPLASAEFEISPQSSKQRQFVAMELQPEFNMTLHWLERHRNQLLTGLLKCCDSFSSEYFVQLPKLGVPEEVAAEVLAAFDTHTVMRCNTVLLLAPSSALPLNLTISVGLTKVGNTSWKIGFRICDKGDPIASISTVCVNVDRETLSKSTPLAHKEHLEPLVCIVPGTSELSAVDVAWEGEIPSTAWTWTTTVRATDCDKLGHVNNAVYALLAEECRAVCALGGFYSASGGQDYAAAEALGAHVDYLNQTLPFEALEIVTWFEGGSTRPGGNGKFCFVFRQRDTVTAHVLLGV